MSTRLTAKIKSRSFLLSCWMLGLPFLVQSQKLSKQQSTAELIFLKQGIEQYNPALNTYNPDFTTKANQLIESVTDSVSLLQHFSKVSKLCALSHEGHFQLGSWTDSVHQGFSKGRYLYLPLSVKVLDGSVYLWNDYSNENQMQRGDRIISINQVPIAQVLNTLYSFLPSDGTITTNLELKAESGFAWLYYFYLEQPSHFNIQYESYPDGKVYGVTIKALPRATQVENYKKRYGSSSTKEPTASIKDFYEWTFTNRYGYLVLKSFDYRLIDTYNLKAKSFYQDIFKALKVEQTPYLIIDLRNNTGGRNAFADAIIPYLWAAVGEDPYFKKTISWKGKEKVYKIPKRSKYAFQGQIYVLVNGYTYSAGASLARYLKEYGRAVVVGTETGSRYEGFAAGSAQDIFLPHTNLRIGIPRYHIMYPASRKQQLQNRGLIPDQVVIPSIGDLITKKDIVLDYVLEQLANSK